MQLEHMLEGAKTEGRSIRSVNLQFCICEADIKTNFIMETYIHQDLRTTKKRSQKKGLKVLNMFSHLQVCHMGP